MCFEPPYHTVESPSKQSRKNSSDSQSEDHSITTKRPNKAVVISWMKDNGMKETKRKITLDSDMVNNLMKQFDAMKSKWNPYNCLNQYLKIKKLEHAINYQDKISEAKFD